MNEAEYHKISANYECVNQKYFLSSALIHEIRITQFLIKYQFNSIFKFI